MIEQLKPARTREECINWLNLRDVDLEVFAAFTGAEKYFLEHDFSKDVLDGAGPCIPNTVVSMSHEGEVPVTSRDAFLETVLLFVTWRILALAERAGVSLDSLDISLPPGCDSAREALQTSYWAPWLGGQVRTITEAEFKTLPKEMQRTMKAAARSGQRVKAKI